MNDNRPIKVGITHGDINGVSYEVILKTLADNHITEICTPIVYGNSRVASFYRKQLEIPQFPFNVINSPAEAKAGEVNFINVVADDVKVEPGQSTRAAGEAAFEALERAVTDLRAGDIDAMVTAPINKSNIQSETFTFPGHTEYLEASIDNRERHALMILFNDVARVALVTTHLPLAKVPTAITKELVLEKLEIFNRSLREDFGIHRPRIAVLSLNPHAGDNGLLGSEEAEVIAPAIAEAEAHKMLVFGPYPADGFFSTGQFRKFDGVLAMYHDQGLAPFKTLAGTAGVNFTAGLSCVRTSPDHGTAYDIAGKGIADETSMRSAIYAAIDILRHRRTHRDITRNPLRRQYVEKNKADNVVLDLTKDDDTL